MNTIMKAMILFITLSVSSVGADNTIYVDIAAGWNPSEESGWPEVTLQTPLARIKGGIANKHNWYIEVEHISSIPMQEYGAGLNTIWIGKRITFK